MEEMNSQGVVEFSNLEIPRVVVGISKSKIGCTRTVVEVVQLRSSIPIRHLDFRECTYRSSRSPCSLYTLLGSSLVIRRSLNLQKVSSPRGLVKISATLSCVDTCVGINILS